ncbi:hypothetical protein GCM10023231_30060 [Olivibacter ginsenosidimutans]|uniref:DUF4185 domain-containing protein n=1 Tax=Olivibacter ginsenosidimutans TaxID=1176537 RepID=A0ABP9BRH2_9SPHI
MEEASEWTTLFAHDDHWIGGDGLFSMALNGIDTSGAFTDTKSLLVFSDSFWGKRANGQVLSGGTMVNNCGAFIQKKTGQPIELHFFNGGNLQQPQSLFKPTIPKATAKSYYWLGDGFVNQEQQGKLYLLAYLMENTGAAVFGFKEFGNALLIIDHQKEAPFKQVKQLQTPLFADSAAHRASYSFGAGVLVNTTWAKVSRPDGFVYIYGVRGANKALLVARVRPKDMEHFDRWTYWNGSQWDPNILHATKIADQVANELSMTPLADGRYLLIFQKNGIEPTIAMRVAESPIGPFGPTIPLYQCPEPAQNKNLFAYNAKAHPTLSNKGELLISYHVNSFNFLEDFKKSPNTFSPKFIRLVFE